MSWKGHADAGRYALVTAISAMSYIARRTVSAGQLEFQFSVGDIAKENIQIQKVSPKGERRSRYSED